MPKTTRLHSPIARSAAELLGRMIRSARLERNMTAAELAERAGVSRPLIARAERGDLGVAIGTMFELSAILGVPLFEEDASRLETRLDAERRAGALLRKRAFQHAQGRVDDDF
ncbi:helix-turn-helix transcriptional regulator [Rubrimonas sp.]|uniref:helix-turn-helix transcriptional regulator n=1 Tax=Rubrimonas sp. TaxID=2036015 RepID=UPI002FDDE268